MLFDMAIEPLATELCTCKDISGIWRGGTEHRVSLYADDLLLFISYPTASLPPALSLLSQFGKFSGYKLNLDKSELFPINNNAQALDLANLPFKIENKKFSYLGISVTRKHKDLFQENFTMLLKQTKQILAQWSPLSLSLVGRINSNYFTKISVPLPGPTSLYSWILFSTS